MDISSVALVCVEHTVTLHVTLHCLQMQANNESFNCSNTYLVSDYTLTFLSPKYIEMTSSC